MVVAISEFKEGGPQFLEMVESAEPQDLFFEGAKEALDTSVGLGCQLHRIPTVLTVPLKSSIQTIR
jgi:hypothetical protein